MTRLLRAIGTLVSLAVVVTAKPAGAQVPTAADLVRQVNPAVVYIATFDSRGQQDGFGSGFVVDDTGVIVTNLHVPAAGASGSVRVADGEISDRAEALDLDARRDLAVLRIRFGTSDPPTALRPSCAPGPSPLRGRSHAAAAA